MQKVTILCVGKLKEKFYLEACKEYQKRLGGYCKLTVTELSEEKLPQNPTQGQIDQALAREAQAIRGKLPAGATLVAMCVEARSAPARSWPSWWTSGPWARASTWCSSSGAPTVWTPPSRSRPAAPVHVPHDLPPPPARVMLLEQIYRSFKINEGSSYHK